MAIQLKTEIEAQFWQEAYLEQWKSDARVMAEHVAAGRLPSEVFKSNPERYAAAADEAVEQFRKRVPNVDR